MPVKFTASNIQKTNTSFVDQAAKFRQMTDRMESDISTTLTSNANDWFRAVQSTWTGKIKGQMDEVATFFTKHAQRLDQENQDYTAQLQKNQQAAQS